MLRDACDGESGAGRVLLAGRCTVSMGGGGEGVK